MKIVESHAKCTRGIFHHYSNRQDPLARSSDRLEDNSDPIPNRLSHAVSRQYNGNEIQLPVSYIVCSGMLVASYHGLNTLNIVVTNRYSEALIQGKHDFPKLMTYGGTSLVLWVISSLTSSLVDRVSLKISQDVYSAYVDFIMKKDRLNMKKWVNIDPVMYGTSALLGTKGYQIIKGSITQCTSLIAVLLGVMLHTFVLSYYVGNKVYILSLSSLLAHFLYLYVSAISNREDIRKQQGYEIALHQISEKSPDNIMLPNLYNFMRWKTNFLKIKNNLFESEMNIENKRLYSDVFNIALLAFVLGGSMYQSALNNPITTALNVTHLLKLGPQTNILAKSMFGMHQTFDSIREMLHEVQESTDKIWENKMDSLVKSIEHIGVTLNHETKNAQTLMRDPIGFYHDGRWRITGPNGAGKSTLLQWIAMSFPSEFIYYFPAKHNLHFRVYNGSSGEIRFLELKEALRTRGKSKIVLLDEWDVHLDPLRKNEINKLLDDIAATTVVIEAIPSKKNK